MEMVTTSRIDEKELPSSTNEDLNEIPNVKALLTRLYYECMKTEKNASEYQNKSGDGRQCPKTFDGYLCWHPTAAGSTVSQHCPDFVTGFDSTRLAYKTCLADGTWYSHPETGKLWSNYTTCVDIEDFENWCVALHVVLHYLMLVNYFWMFCEGLHLHLVLVVVFVKDAVAMRWFMIIGWILPIILVSVYAVIRGQNPIAARQCWMEDSVYMWILTIPVCISLIASMVFLINVVRVLLTKLHPCSAQPAPLGLRKAVRATLILVPLFGLQHILLPFRPDTGSPLEKYYQVASAILVSLQGFCVSCLFCFMNHDVIFALWNLLSRLFPSITPNMRWESVNGPQATQSRDVVV
ncbi:calcitonin receptor isoform X2 [Phlebotomus papatasi]|uniref:calcitonin receptor isoform X2 n=1 Tax=Phlebotomus papatasi TaxID=29031 RepID=UPI002483E4D8|nr:calcitonin receptor isoform X2 [Phlebotomus papatasi]